MTDITQSLSNLIVSGLNPDKRYTENEQQVFTYGIELILNSLLKITVYLIIGFLLGTGKEVITTLFIFGILRKLSGGSHARTNLGCFLITGSILALSVGIPYILCVSKQVYPLIAAMIWTIYVLFAPRDQYNEGKEKAANMQKAKSVIILSMLFLIGYFQESYWQSLLLYITSLQGITLIRFENRKN